MSSHYLLCDCCLGRQSHERLTITAARRAAKKHGWRTRVIELEDNVARKSDLCPECDAELKKRKATR